MEQRPGTITVEAKTLELALQKAALTLGVSQERLGHEIIKDSGNGIMSLLTGRRIQITAWRKAASRPLTPISHDRRGDRNGRDDRGNRDSRPRRTDRDQQRTQPRASQRRDYDEFDQSDDDQPAVPPRQLSPEEIDALKDEVKTFWQELCSGMAGEDVEVAAEVDNGRLSLRAKNDYLASQLSKNGKLAEAFEHILRKKPRHLRQELPFRIFVDINDIRKQREDELVTMAKDLSAQVHENRKPIVLNYKSPYERKIIHMALDKDERVYTKSIGSGSGRKLMILPIGERGNGAPIEETFQS